MFQIDLAKMGDGVKVGSEAFFAARRAANAMPGVIVRNSRSEPKTLVGMGLKKQMLVVKLLGDIAGNDDIEQAVRTNVEAAIKKSIELKRVERQR